MREEKEIKDLKVLGLEKQKQRETIEENACCEKEKRKLEKKRENTDK